MCVHCTREGGTCCVAPIPLERATNSYSATFGVTKRHNIVNRFKTANSSRKSQQAHSKTESRPTSADQQHKNGSTHEQGPKQPSHVRPLPDIDLLPCVLSFEFFLQCLLAL